MRHLRFRLRTMFALLTLSAIWYGISALHVQRQRIAVSEIRRLGGHVLYEAAAYDAEPLRLRNWLTSVLGPDWVHAVDGVELPRATDESVAMLHWLPEIRKLGLGHSRLTSRGLKQIAALSQLESLTFDRGMIDDACVQSLADLKHLKHLEIRGGAITDASMPVISGLPAIQSLLLADCTVSDDGLNAFRDSPKIRWLGLSCAKITEASAPVFATMPNLKELHLGQGSSRNAKLQPLAGLGQLRAAVTYHPIPEAAEATRLYPASPAQR